MELIDRKAVLSILRVLGCFANPKCLDGIRKKVKELPTVDAVPVRLGFWEGVDSSYWRWYPEGARVVERITYRCSRCARGSIIKTNYCPNCGADMRGAEDG